MEKNVTANRITAIIIIGIVLIVVGLYVVTQYVGGADPVVNQESEFEQLYKQTLEGGETDKNFLYNGFVFIEQDGLWKTLLQEPDGDTFLLSTHYNPRETEEVPISVGMRSLIIPKNFIIVTMDANLTSKAFIGVYEVGKVIGDKFGFFDKPAIVALTSPVNATPVATCQNVSRQTGIIYFHLDDITSVFADKQGCIHVTGTNEDEIIRASDRLLYTLLGMQTQEPLSAESFDVNLRLANWKGDAQSDGFELVLDFYDSRDIPVSTEGVVVVNITANGQVVEEWKTPLVLDYYNQSGTARLNLAIKDLRFLRSNVTLSAQVGVLQKDMEPLRAVLPLQQ